MAEYTPEANLIWVLAQLLSEEAPKYRQPVDWINYAGKMLDLEGVTNIGKAKLIVVELEQLRGVQRALKAAFAHRELDGGPVAATTHPLYLEAERRIAELDEELTILI